MILRRALPVAGAVVAGWLLVAASPARAQTGPGIDRPPVVVADGEAVIRRAPDRAYVSVAVESRAPRPDAALARNAAVMTTVQQRLVALGLPKTAVETLAYSLEQEFDFVDGKRIPKDYLATNVIRITLDDLGRVGPTIDAAVQAGADRVQSIRFDLRDREAVEREALTKAAADARARAQAAAAGVGRTLDRIVRIDATSTPSPRPTASPLLRAAPAAADTPISPGEIEIRARVILTATLK